MEEYLTVRQAAELMGIPYEKLLRLIQQGKFPAQKQGWVYLVRKKDVIERMK